MSLTDLGLDSLNHTASTNPFKPGTPIPDLELPLKFGGRVAATSAQDLASSGLGPSSGANESSSQTSLGMGCV